QRRIVDDMLGDVTGLRIADVACGTGRASRHLARRGARVVGLDFAPKTLDAARRETAAESLSVEYRHFDALGRTIEPDLVEQFDVALSISCMSVACSSLDELDRALANIVRLVRPSGRILLLEPLHAFWLVRRILKLDVASFVARAERSGLRLLSHR